MKLNRIYLTVAAVALLTLFALAFAQVVEPNWNVGGWSGSLLLFAGGVISIVTVIRRYVWTTLDGPLVQAVAVAVGVVAGIGLAIAGQYDSILAGAWNGLLAGAASFLGVDVIRDVVGGQGTSGKALSD